MNNIMTICPEIGKGIYTVTDASMILNLQAPKVRRWIKNYWESSIPKHQKCSSNYTWGYSRDKAFNFYTLIELIAVDSFRTLGLSFNKILEAHKLLSDYLETDYPFANTKLLSDGKKIFLEEDDSRVLGIDPKLQYSFREMVAPYCKKIDFSEETKLANRYWPLGKKHSIIVDPHHGFGQPTIVGTNISIFTLISMLSSGESKQTVADMYNLDLRNIEDTILFKMRIAA